MAAMAARATLTPASTGTGGVGATVRKVMDAPLESPGVCFFLFVVLLAIEYIGLGQRYSIIRISRISTIIAYLLLVLALARGGLSFITESRQGRILGTFVVFTAAGVLWAVVRSIVPVQARYLLDYLGLFTITTWLVTSRARIDQLSMLFAGISFVLVLQNLGMLLSSTRTGFMRAAYFMGDGNDFAWGLNTMLPFALNLMIGRRWITTRAIGLAMFLAIAFATVGTQSRGATLAIGAAIFMFWLTISKRKMIGVAIIGVLVAGTLVVAPGAYIERMAAMTEYESDSSAQGRLRAWRAAVHMAIDFPLGVGANNFSRAYGRFYIPEDTSGYKAFRWISPHSVYFRVLGEYGFPGLFLLLGLLWANFKMNRDMARRIRAQPSAYDMPEHWPALMNVGLVAYAVGGMFLGGFAYPHLFLMSGLTVGCYRIVLATDARLAAATPGSEPERAPVVAAGPLNAQWQPAAARLRRQ